MTPDQLALLQAVNTDINAIPYNATPNTEEPPDWWSTEQKAGWSFVCRQYAQVKAQKLREAGWPIDAIPLLERLCYDEVGDYHSVLAVMDGEDEWILDNRYPGIYRKGAASGEPYAQPSPYRWVYRQVAGENDFEAIA